MKFLFFKFFLCLSLLTGWELTAQNSHDSLHPPISKSHNIAAPKISENGKWGVLRKRSWMPALEMKDLDADTVMIFRILKGKKSEIVGYRKNIRQVFFIGDSHLLLKGNQQTEFIDLKKSKSRYFKDIKNIKVLNDGEHFILYYRDNRKNKLEVRNDNGKLLTSLKNVEKIYTSETGQIYVVIKSKKKEFELILLKGKTEKRLYQTLNDIKKLDIDPKERGIMIYEQKQGDIYQQIRYLDLKTNTTFSLKDVLPFQIERASREVVQEGESYFLRLHVPRKKENSTMVDIWYGNDNALEKKFYSPKDEVYYLWYPKNKKVFRIGTDTLTRNVLLESNRYFLSFNPFLLQDYTKPTPYQINIYDRLKKSYTIVDTISQKLHVSPNGRYILYKKNNSWFNYDIATKVKKIIPNESLKTPYFSTDGKMVYFKGNSTLWKYDPVSNNLETLKSFRGYQIEIVNSFYSKNFMRLPCYQKLINMQKPLIIRLYDPIKNKSSYILWREKKFDTIIPLTKNYIREFNYNTSYSYFSYIEENYNLPPRLIFKKMGGNKKAIYQSNKKDKKVKQEIITYTNKRGAMLKGVLYYPIDFDKKKKYPMIVHIYQKQYHSANRYPYPSYFNGKGFNIRLLLENGYFVYLPDIEIKENEGPGMGALVCVDNALDALSGKISINKQKMGLIGHSFGGYETNFIATHSSRFATYVAGAGIGNLTQMYFSFNYAFKFPDYFRVETLQFDFKTAFANKKTQFYENNPVYYAENINAPILLWSGSADINVSHTQSMAMYTALRRYHKPVIALFYKNEGHSLQNQKAQVDLTQRIVEWFDYFLKDIENIKWIEKEISKDAP